MDASSFPRPAASPSTTGAALAPATAKVPLVDALRRSIAHIGLALRDPEEFAARRHRGEVEYESAVWCALTLTAILGTTVYGMTMGIGSGLQAVCSHAVLLTLSAGLAWAIPLPALYILNSFAGSRLRPSTTLLAALVTTSWGGLALSASVPIYWLVRVAVPELPFLAGAPRVVELALTAINLLVFAGVGVSMIDVFNRVLRRLEPRREDPPVWYLMLVGLIGAQLFVIFGLFDFAR